LDAEGAFVNLSGIYLNHKEYFTDHHTLIRHKKPHTNSKEDYRGILNDEARAVFNGQIKIDPFAIKSDSDQINKNLMLSSKAEVDTKPELQIYNDDVKAAHGATIGQLDDDQKFYLQSRGYSEVEANRILARAFVYDLLEDQSDWVQKFISQDLDEYLKTVQGE
jgi:Fe-S cluster assembly protein SufD